MKINYQWTLTLLSIQRTLALVASLFLATTDIAVAGQETFKDWQVICEADVPCRMVQTIVQTELKRPILQIRVFDDGSPTMLLTFPLGILLSPGWQYQIDGGRATRVPFELCNLDGCHAGLPLSKALLTKLKRGNTFKVTFWDAESTAVNPEISLAGFTKAFGALKP